MESQVTTRLHPAAEWAMETCFNASQVDCTIAVVLKILDNKCKMLPGEKAAIMEIYNVAKEQPGDLYSGEIFKLIDKFRLKPTNSLAQTIHELRVHAEANIPKPVMKAYKAMLREGLFG